MLNVNSNLGMTENRLFNMHMYEETVLPANCLEEQRSDKWRTETIAAQ